MALKIQTTAIRSGYDKKTCFVHLRPGRLSDGTHILTTQPLRLRGMDHFGPIHTMISTDDGQTWSEPAAEAAFAGRSADGITCFCCDFVPALHKATERLLGIGQTVYYTGAGTIAQPRRRETCYSVYDEAAQRFRTWKTLQLPRGMDFLNSGAGCAQRCDLPDGTILLPFYFQAPHTSYFQSAVMTLGFDKETLSVLSVSAPVCTDSDRRGSYEPSLAGIKDQFFLTLRTDGEGYVCQADHSLRFSELRPWQWETGKAVGIDNTQQHFVTLGEHLYLVYTRRGLANDHVFRHRAPLLIARVDTGRLCLLRDTEQILVEQRGARLGNFGVCQNSENDAWVTVSEWMQPIGCERYGSDNAFFLVRISEGC